MRLVDSNTVTVLLTQVFTNLRYEIPPWENTRGIDNEITRIDTGQIFPKGEDEYNKSCCICQAQLRRIID